MGASKCLAYGTSLLPLTLLIHPSTIFSHPLLYTWWARFSLAFSLSISNLTYSLDFYPLFSQFWNFDLHQKHLAGLLKHRLLTLGSLIPEVLGQEWKFTFLTSFQVMLILLAFKWNRTLRITGLSWVPLLLPVPKCPFYLWLDTGLLFYSLKPLCLGELISSWCQHLRCLTAKCLSFTGLMTSVKLGHLTVC